MARVAILVILLFLQGFLLFRILHTPEFLIAFLDVGQGDAIYIRAPNGNDVLIDGGSGSDVLRELPLLMGPLDRSIDVVIATHPDKDHIGGLVEVFDQYHVTTFIDPGVENTTQVYRALMERVAKEAVPYVARTGMNIHLGRETAISVLFPDRAIRGDTNNASVVTKVSHGDVDILLTGDAGVRVEKFLLAKDIESEILKVGHHGSRTSSDRAFIREVSPAVAVISAGADNSYGHPHDEVLETLRLFVPSILETRKEGTIIFTSDGTTFTQR